MIALLVHSLKRVRTIVLAIGLLLMVLQFVLILVAGSLESSGQFAQLATLLPPFVRALIGPSVTAFLSFGGIVSLGYFEPGVLFAFVGLAIAVSTRIAFEVEIGFMDLLLARPLPRHLLVTRAILVSVLSLGLVVGLMLGGTWTGLRMLAPANAEMPPVKMILGLAGNLALLGLAWSGISLAIASVSRRRGVAAGVSAVLALVAFLLDYVARLWAPAAAYAWVSPFVYFSPFELVMGAELPGRNVAVLAGIGLSGFAVAYGLFGRRDVAR